MSQGGLFGEPQLVQKYFYAFKPPAEVASQIAELQSRLMRKHGLSGKPIREELLHMTVCHLQEFDGTNPDFERKATRAGESLVHAPVTITLDRVASFEGNPSNRPFVMRGGEGVKEVEAFQPALHVAMSAAGLSRYAKPYTPHMTLTYDRKLVAEEMIEPITWQATELLLVRSPQGLGEHHHLQRWPLKG